MPNNTVNRSKFDVTIDNVWFYKANGSFNFHKSATATNCMLHVTNAGVFDLPNDVLPSSPIVDVESLDFYVSSSMNGVEQHRVFKDTITPPSNPMYEVPYIPGTYTFRGVLQLEYFFGQLFCVVRTANNDYFMIDDGINYIFRLDNPQLKNCVVGDTIMVCAVPMKLLPTDAKSEYSLATYYVYPKIVSSNNK